MEAGVTGNKEARSDFLSSGLTQAHNSAIPKEAADAALQSEGIPTFERTQFGLLLLFVSALAVKHASCDKDAHAD